MMLANLAVLSGSFLLDLSLAVHLFIINVHLHTHLFCFKYAQDTVRYGTSVIEWIVLTP